MYIYKKPCVYMFVYVYVCIREELSKMYILLTLSLYLYAVAFT